MEKYCSPKMINWFKKLNTGLYFFEKDARARSKKASLYINREGVLKTAILQEN